MKQITAVLIGAGARGQIYAQYAQLHPEELKIVAVAEPNKERRDLICKKYGLQQQYTFDSWEEVFEHERIADAALICTLDEMHTEPTLLALKKGYHVLLEKPMSNTEKECLAIAKAAQEAGRVLSVCHVLRYTPFYSTLKSLIVDGTIGEVASITQVENVGYWHYAHSFVRGNWRNSDTTSPMILQKSCHDMDIILWLIGQDCKRVSSFGSLRYFNKEHAPKDAPERCMDGCAYSQTCPYYAPKIYLTDNIGWPTDMIATDLSYEGRCNALKQGPYGRCVYHCDNNVVDRQVVNLEFASGAVASFTMTAFTSDMARQLKITGTKGQITADMNTNTIALHKFEENIAQNIPVEMPSQTNNYGHGGGDYYLMRDFVCAVQENGKGNRSSAQVSLQSHQICFAAERSRVEHITVEL